MDYLPDTETLTLWLTHYGSFALFALLALGIIALPIPDESLMVIAGILMSNETLKIPSTIIAAVAGAFCGITFSYFIGRTAGKYIIKRYGSWVGITEKQLDTVHQWFEKFGKWTLLIGYFIPGIRHFSGISAGITNLEYHHFACFAYTGAFLWVATFLSIGYFFGNYGIALFENIEIGMEEIIIGLIVLIAIWVIFRLRKSNDKK